MMNPRTFSAAELEDMRPPLPSVASREICCVAWWVERRSTFPCIFFGLDSRDDERWRDELLTVNALTSDLHAIGFPAIYFLSLDLSEEDKLSLEEQYEAVLEFTIISCSPELLLLLQSEFCDIGFSKRGQPGAFFLATTPQKVVYSWAATPSSSTPVTGALACVAGRQLRLPPSLSSVIKSLADELKDGEERIVKATPAAQPVTIFSVFNQRIASCVGWARRVSSSRASSSSSSSAEEDHEALATVSFMPLSSSFSTTTTSSLHS